MTESKDVDWGQNSVSKLLALQALASNAVKSQNSYRRRKISKHGGIHFLILMLGR